MIKATLLFNNIRLKSSQIHKFRGFVGNLLPEYDVIHNHDLTTGKPIYRYPLIQFKLIEHTPVIMAITDKAVKEFSQIFMTLNEIVIDDFHIPVYEKDLQVQDVPFGYADEFYVYEFVSPWIGLNQKNYQNYTQSGNKTEKDEILAKALVGNFLSMSKSLDLWLEKEQKIRAEIGLREIPVNLKGKSMIGFLGVFKCNFLIPDYMGVGKSVSRGFGAVRKVI